MRFLSVAERELRAGARHKATHRLRWITAGAFFALLAWLMWVFDGFRAPQIFHAFSVITLLYCLIVGTAGTADCLSSEKREGTMGLLFLTNLNSPEIVGGKLCSNALAAAYGLAAIFPLLALQMLIGGVTLGCFWRTFLALLDAILFAVASGFLASSIFIRQFTAIATGTGLALFFSLGLMGLASALDALLSTTVSSPWVNCVAIFSPLYSLVAAEAVRVFGANHYWWSVLVVNSVSVLFLAVATWRVSRSWRDRPATARVWSHFRILQTWQRRGEAGRAALRQRLLRINPFFWLGGRGAVSAPIFMLITIFVVAITSYIAAPYFGRTFGSGTSRSLIGHVFAWLWAGLAIHALVLYYAAMAASRRLAEDKQTGALELVLSTPTSERSILRGLWMAYARRMFFPVTVAILVHFFFVWQLAMLAVLDPPTTRLPPGTTAWELLWHALLGTPIAGVRLEWGFAFLLRAVLLYLLMAVVCWVTLGWLARWLGLRMKHPGFAPMVSLALLLIPPVVIFSIVCYCADQSHFFHLPERTIFPLVLWTALGIGLGHCLMLSLWAAGHLRKDFRTVVTSRFQPKSLRPWWRPTQRQVLRFATGCLAIAAILSVIIFGFYGYNNWRSHKSWRAFQAQLKRNQASLDLSPLLPGPVPDSENFARTKAFQDWIAPSTNGAATKRLIDRLKESDIASTQGANNSPGMQWVAQTFSPFDDYLGWVAPEISLRQKATREEYAAALLRALQPHEATMRALASAARLAQFQSSTNKEATVVFQPGNRQDLALERLHMLFQIRASALLAANRRAEAAEDLLTGLQLVRLARHLADVQSSTRTQVMLVRSLQPLWEGVVDQSWTDEQLAAFQNELSRFSLLSDYTNNLRRVILANIETWRAIADGKTDRISPVVNQGEDPSVWRLQPRAWWLDNSVQLYQAGEFAIQSLDVAGAHMRSGRGWGDIDGLPLDRQTTYLFQQIYWSGAYPGNVVFAQTAVNQAIIACALERFRLAHGKFPETLDELLPKYLTAIPNDIITGRPMLYEHRDDSHFILRGVGPNQIDDRKNKSSDDWLWSFPTNAPPTAIQPGGK